MPGWIFTFIVNSIAPKDLELNINMPSIDWKKNFNLWTRTKTGWLTSCQYFHKSHNKYLISLGTSAGHTLSPCYLWPSLARDHWSLWCDCVVIISCHNPCVFSVFLPLSPLSLFLCPQLAACAAWSWLVAASLYLPKHQLSAQAAQCSGQCRDVARPQVLARPDNLPHTRRGTQAVTTRSS